MINHTMYAKICNDCNSEIETTVYTTAGVCVCTDCYYKRIEDRNKLFYEEQKKEIDKFCKKNYSFEYWR